MSESNTEPEAVPKPSGGFLEFGTDDPVSRLPVETTISSSEIPEGPPMRDSERKVLEERQAKEAAKPEEERPKEAPASAEAKDPKANGEAPEAETSKEEDPLAGILAKYGDTPREIAKAYKSLQQMLTAKEQDQKATLDAVSALLDMDDAGNFVVRPDVAAKALAARRGKDADVEMPSSDALSKERVEAMVLAELREEMQAMGVDTDEDLDLGIENLRKTGKFDRRVQERFHTLNTAVQASRGRLDLLVHQKLDEHLKEHPGDEKVWDRVSEWFELIPEENGLRAQALLKGWFPLAKIAQYERERSGITSDIKDAFEKGREFERRAASKNASEAGAPSGSGAGARRAGTPGQTEEDRIKASVLGTDRVPWDQQLGL